MGRETNKQRREKQASSAREKAAEARAIQARADQRRRAVTILSSIVGIAVVGALIAVIAITSGGKNDTTRPVAQTAIVDAVTGVSAADINQVGDGGTNLDNVKAISDTALTKDGKPQVLFIGAEFCPFCAAERWSLVQALSRFGTFSNLKQIRSSVTDGNLATFSFYKSSYTSKYVDFNPVEFEDRNSAKLESTTAAEQKVWLKYTGQGSFPFLDFGGKYVQTQVGFSDQDLNGMSWTDIADAIKDPTSKVGKDVIGEANSITAMICKLTNGQPSTVCSASGVTGITLPTASA